MKAVKPDLGQTSFRRSTQLSVLTSWLDFVYSQYMYCFLIFFLFKPLKVVQS